MTIEKSPEQPSIALAPVVFRAYRRVLNVAEIGKTQQALQDCCGDAIQPLSYRAKRSEVTRTNSIEVMSRVAANQLLSRLAGSNTDRTVLRGTTEARLDRVAAGPRATSLAVTGYNFYTTLIRRNTDRYLVSLVLDDAEPIVTDRNVIFRALANDPMAVSTVSPAGTRLPIAQVEGTDLASEIDGLHYTRGANLRLGPLQFSYEPW